MGLLKIGSIYKKKKKDDYVVSNPSVPVPKLDSLSFELNLDLNDNSPITEHSTIAPSTAPPIASGSLYDDILSELKSNTQEDTLESDFSLALALSQKLSLEHDSTSNKPVMSNNETVASTNKKEDFLFGTDSIYSSYLKNMSALETTTTTTNNESSMFDFLINKNNTTATISNIPQVDKTPNTATVVLDSDISDSDEESKRSDESDDDNELFTGKKQNKRRMAKGLQPIMERRGQNNNLSVQRKIDNWSNRLDENTNQSHVNQSVIERMKDRHRDQAKLTALRQQQIQQMEEEEDLQYMAYNNMMMLANPHMFPQTHGVSSAMALSQNIALPPNLLIEPNTMYFPPPSHHDLPQDIRYQNAGYSPMSAGPVPNINHYPLATLDKQPDEVPRRSKISTKPAKSLSTPTATKLYHPQKNLEQSFYTNANSNHHTNSPYSEESSPFTTSSTLESIQEYEPNQQSALPIPYEMVATEADLESSDESVMVHKQKSLKITNQKAVNEINTNVNRQIRTSKSTPNLKKKKSAKKGNGGSSKVNSRSNSRRNSQEYVNFPPYEINGSSPPPPLPQQYHTKKSIRHMKSEPEISKRKNNNTQQHYQHQLSNEWERMQLFQREQQLMQQQMSMMYGPPMPASRNSRIVNTLSSSHMKHSHQMQMPPSYYTSG